MEAREGEGGVPVYRSLGLASLPDALVSDVAGMAGMAGDNLKAAVGAVGFSSAAAPKSAAAARSPAKADIAGGYDGESAGAGAGAGGGASVGASMGSEDMSWGGAGAGALSRSVSAATEADAWDALAALEAPQFDAVAHAHNSMVAYSPVTPLRALRTFQQGLSVEGAATALCTGDGSEPVWTIECSHGGFAPPLRMRVSAFSSGGDGSVVVMRRLYGDEGYVFELFDAVCAGSKDVVFEPACSDVGGEEYGAFNGGTDDGATDRRSPSFDDIDWGFSGDSSASLSSSLPSDPGMAEAAAGGGGGAAAGGSPAASDEDQVRAMLETVSRAAAA